MYSMRFGPSISTAWLVTLIEAPVKGFRRSDHAADTLARDPDVTIQVVQVHGAGRGNGSKTP